MFKKYKFKNGLRVIVAPFKGMNSVTLLVMVGAGSKYEKKELNGLSHFLEHMFFKGTKKRPSTLAISEYLDEVGGEFNAFTSKEYTGFYAKVALRYIDRAFDIISDILSNSKLEVEEIRREKGVIIEEMNLYRDTPVLYVNDLFEKLLYKNQPAGRLVIGEKTSVSGLKREHFLNYLKNFYVTSNIVVCVVGDIKETQAVCLVKKFFSKIKRGTPKKKLPVIERQRQPQILIHHKKTDQTHFCLGVRGYNIFHPDRYILDLLGVILGDGMSSRLFISVRERQGLAYYIKALTEYYTDSGYLVVQAGVDNMKFLKALEIILKEFRHIKEQKLGEKELRKAKEYIKGKTILALDTSEEIANWLGHQEILTSKIESLKEKFTKVDAVTINDIKRVANDILVNKKLNLALIGPIKNKKEIQKVFKV